MSKSQRLAKVKRFVKNIHKIALLHQKGDVVIEIINQHHNLLDSFELESLMNIIKNKLSDNEVTVRFHEWVNIIQQDRRDKLCIQ